MVSTQGIRLKKKYGQHFLQDQSIADAAVNKVDLTPESSVFEIGCGEGFLTRTILKKPIKRLWIFEIDEEWVDFIKNNVSQKKITIFNENILDTDFSIFEEHKPWTLLTNLPYQITFPILQLLYKHRSMLKEGVMMIQEEVAQKLVKTRGKGYGFPSLFYNYYFDVELMQKVPPSAFLPPPKVDSRLIYLRPKKNVKPIDNEEQFWKFVKLCFGQARRTLRNNLAQTHYDLSKLSEQTLALRAQQMNMDDLLVVWNSLNSSGDT